MRRGSLIGPLLLILIGLLFLMRNLHPEWVSLGQIARYWPFLLIAWGLLRLIEIAALKISGRPLPPKGVSGGEWTLVVFICLVGTGVFYAHERLPRIAPIIRIGQSAELFGEPFDYPVAEQARPVTGSLLVIENLRGNVRIAGGEAQEVRVSGRKTIRAYRRTDADEADRKTPVEIVIQGDQVVIRTNQERAQGDLRVATDLEIIAPRTMAVRAGGRSGDYDVLNMRSVDLKSESAAVRVQDIAGDVRADVRRSSLVRAANVKGDVEIMGTGRDIEVESVGGKVTVNGSFSGTIQCRNLAKPLVFQSGVTELRVAQIPGQLQMDLGELTLRQASGPIFLTAKTKDVRITDFSGELHVTVDRGDVTIAPQKPPSAGIDVTTRSGDVELVLPQGAAFELEAATLHGEAENDFGPPLALSSEDRGGVVKGLTGKGPRVTARTNRGRVTVRKG